MQETARKCLSCDKPVRGRSDKKFCDDYCRNAYNNRIKSKSSNFIRNVNNALLRNRRILQNILSGDSNMTETSGSTLRSQGFHFGFHTHTYTTKKGRNYRFCYEYGYLTMENDWYLIVRRDNDSPG